MVRLERALLFLVILFLPTQLGKHFWPASSLVYSLPIDYLSPQVYFWDLLVVGYFVVWLVRKPQINKSAMAFLLVYVLSQVMSLLKAGNVTAGLVRIEQIGLVGVFGLIIASGKLAEDGRIYRLALLIAVVFESFLAITQVVLGRSVGLWLLGERSFDISAIEIARFNWFGQVFLRAYGTFSHPNVLAGFMVIVLPIIVSLSVRRRWSLLLGSVATMISFSRAGMLVLLVEWLIYFGRRWNRVALILAVLSPLIVIRFSSAFDFDYLSILRREELAVNAWSFFVSSPLVGIGLNNFINQTANSMLISGSTRFLQPVHNIFLLTISESGLIGLVGYLALIGSAIVRLWVFRKVSFARSLLFCWISIIFLGLIDHYFLTLAQGQRLFFLVWGLSWQMGFKSGNVKMSR